MRKQDKVLKIIICMLNNIDDVIYQPKNFEKNFPFVSSEQLITALKILAKKGLITVNYADLPNSVNIRNLSVTTEGYNYFPTYRHNQAVNLLGNTLSFALGIISAIISQIIISNL